MDKVKSGCLSIVVGIVALIVIGVGVIWFISRPLHKPSFNAEIVVDLVVDDEQVRIQRVVECKTVALGGSWSTLGKRRATRYKTDVGAFGKKLKSGGAIMMWTPYRCAHTETEKSFWHTARNVIPNEPGFIPFMGWTPNADTFDILELYPAASYFRKPDARVKLVKLIVRDAPSGARADPPDAFEWFTQKSIKGEKRKTGMQFRGTNALILKEQDWIGRDPRIDALLKNRDSLWALPRKPAKDGFRAGQRVEEFFKAYFTSFGNSIRGSSIPKQRRFVWKPKDAADGPVTDTSSISKSLALKWDSAGQLHFSRASGKSFIRMYRRGTVPVTIIQKATMKRGSDVFRPNPTNSSDKIFDPDSREILMIFLVSYVGHPRR